MHSCSKIDLLHTHMCAHMQPKWFHVPYLAFVGLFMRSGMNRAFDKYQPDAVVGTLA